jgi:hypothetical protein
MPAESTIMKYKEVAEKRSESEKNGRRNVI